MVKRLLGAAMALCLAASCFVGCGKKGSKAKLEDDPNEKVELHWVFGGPGKLEDSDKVWAEFNKKLEEYLPNTTVKFTCIPQADYAEKWRLMSSAREDVDIAWVSWALTLDEEARKGSYMDLTELINEYGKDMTAELPDWIFDLTTIDGKIYAIPNYQMMGYPMAYTVPVEHVEKGWIDLEEASKVFMKDTPLTKEDLKIFDDYLKKVKESGEETRYVSKDFLNAIKRIGMPVGYIEPISANAKIAKYEDNYKIYDLENSFPESYDYYEVVTDWFNKGYIRPDILENSTDDTSKTVLNWTSYLKGCDERASADLGRKVKAFPIESEAYINYKGSPTNTAIASQSKHPARAMKLLNLMNSSKGAELMNLLTYGIEGEHYEKVSDTQIKWLGKSPAGSSDNKYGYNNWALGNALVTYTTETEPEGWNDYIHNEINAKAKMSKLAGFTLDTKPIKLEIANYFAVYDEYRYLDYGTVPNWKELVEERNQKYKEAGSDKIIKEVQRQVDEWVKEQKK